MTIEPLRLSAQAVETPLFARFAGMPALISREGLPQFESCLIAASKVERIGDMLQIGADAAASEDGFWPAPDSWMARYRPYVVVDGVLQIPVKGILLSDFSFAIGSWATGYVYLRRAYERGMADGNVRGIAWLHDSFGGEAKENFELCDVISAGRGKKPMRSFCEFSYSASYSLATCADRIMISRTSGVGSIGVVMTHVDISKALDDAGYKVTLIEAPKGGHKTDSYPYKPLSPDGEKSMQKRVDMLYDIFVSTVARNRGMTEAAVRGTEARTFIASEALSNGLADAVGVIADEVAAFAADLTANEGNEDMSTTSKEGGNGQAATISQADVDQARAAGVTSGKEQGKAEGLKEGATAERARCKAIMSSEHVAGREAMAAYLAFDTDMTTEAAVAVLEKSPKGATGTLASDMSRETQPELGGGSAASKPANDFEAGRAAVLARKGKTDEK